MIKIEGNKLFIQNDVLSKEDISDIALIDSNRHDIGYGISVCIKRKDKDKDYTLRMRDNNKIIKYKISNFIFKPFNEKEGRLQGLYMNEYNTIMDWLHDN